MELRGPRRLMVGDPRSDLEIAAAIVMARPCNYLSIKAGCMPSTAIGLAGTGEPPVIRSGYGATCSQGGEFENIAGLNRPRMRSNP